MSLNQQEHWRAAQEFSTDQINRQVDSILNSKHFRQAKSLEKFLRYVIERKLAGAESELKEYTIGVEVFQRGGDYDPRRDAVVRVQANLLRKRLASYYGEEGLLDEIVVDLPKGHYVPQFNGRSENADPAHLEAQAADAVLTEPAAEAPSPTVSKSRRLSPWPIAATFVLGLLTAFALQYWLGELIAAEKDEQAAADAAHNPAADPIYRPLWGEFFKPGVENILAYGTPQFFVSNGVYLRDVKINSPQEIDPGSRLIQLQKAVDAPFTPTETYTGVGETHGVYLLTRFFSRTANELRVTRSRMVGWSELKNSNVIFLSSMRFHTLAKELPYPSDFAINPGISSAVINLRPGAGEEATYGGKGNGDEYAVLTVWPGKLHQRRIVILSGSTTWATLAAAEYVTDPEYLRQLNQRLEQCRAAAKTAQHAPFFQVVLHARVKDNLPVSISYVTHHDLQIADPDADPAKPIEQVALHR